MIPASCIRSSFLILLILFLLTTILPTFDSCFGDKGMNSAHAADTSLKGDYSRVDSYALAAGREDERSVNTLASYLSKGAENDEEKARAIFRWLTDRIAYDTKGYRRGSYGDLSPEGVLKSRVSVCNGYANLFEALASAMGLKSVVVPGYAKGYGYRQGSTIKGANHAWNVVWVKGRWRLVDATWGAGFMDEKYRFKRKLTEFYFMPSPGSLIFSHLPDEERWQLLNSPVKREEFGQMAFLKPGFFNAGLRLKSHYRSGLVSQEAFMRVELFVPDEMLFSVSLLRKGKELPQNYFLQRENGVAGINMSFPRKGDYVLRIFAGTPGRDGSRQLEWAIDYNIKAKRKTSQSFPIAYTIAGKCTLISPLRGDIPKGESVDIKVRVPEAKAVSVFGDSTAPLEADGDVYSGRYTSDGGKFTICADFEGLGEYNCIYGFNEK